MSLEIRPQPGPQERFLASSVDVAIYGGAAGGGKTWALLLDPIRHKDVKGFGAVFFRREVTQISKEGGLWDESQKLYPLLAGKPTQNPYRWMFPAGVKFSMEGIEHEKDMLKWQGAQIPAMLFDELTHFTRAQFFYMMSRNRSTCGVRPYIRATCNPDPDSWVLKDFLDWYIGPDGYPIPERAGVVRHFVNINDTLRWANSKQELLEEYGADCDPMSFTFIPSSVYDNKILLTTDPAYLTKLKALPLDQQMRLLKGNWRFKSEGGLVKRDQIRHMREGDVLPVMRRVVVAIDPAVSAHEGSSETGIIACGLGVDGLGYILEDVSDILTPERWARRAVNTYEHYDADLIVGEVNNGGDLVERNIRVESKNINYKAVRASRGKIVRLEPIAALYAQGKIVHAKRFDKLESQLCSYNPATDERSPDRMDGAVWGLTELMLSGHDSYQTKLKGM